MRYDVAIIGAGPAGCAAAITLARAGRPVIVLEKRTFPRHKVCGGCLSGWAVRQLRELLGEQCRFPGAAGSQIVFAVGGRVIRCSAENRTHVVMRADLDLMLARAAGVAGAEFRFGQQAGLVRTCGKYEVTVGQQSIEAETVLLASGLSGLASKAGFHSLAFGSPMIARQWLTDSQSIGVSPGAVEMHWFRGGYLGLAAPNERDCIVALAMNAKELGGIDPLCALQRMNLGADLWDRLGSSHECQVRGAAGFPFVPNEFARANVMLIGDAAGYAEPFSGTGIGMAIHSGISAARAIIAGGEVAQQYARDMRPHRRTMWRTRILSAVLNSGIPQRFLHQASPRMDNLISNLVRRVHVRSAV